MRHIIVRQKGFAIVFAIALMLVLSILGMSMVFLSRQEATTLVLQKKADACFYIAEAGCEAGVAIIRAFPPALPYTTGEVAIGDGSYLVNISSFMPT